MDARRNQVYAAAYEFRAEGADFRLSTVIGQVPIDIVELICKINALQREVIFLGEGLRLWRRILCLWKDGGGGRTSAGIFEEEPGGAGSGA